MFTADKDYYLDADGNLAKSEKDAAFLLIRKGQEMPKAEADKYGLGKTEKADKSAENKAAKASENKAKK